MGICYIQTCIFYAIIALRKFIQFDTYKINKKFTIAEEIMKYRYSRWIALFTGASAGLCPEFMNAIYADSRYRLIREVWLIDKSLPAMQAIADRFPGKKVRMIVLDLSDLQQVKDFAILLKTYDPYIRLMINNVSQESIGDFSDYSARDVEALMNINVNAPVLLLKLCQPHIMIGTVVIMFSSAGSITPMDDNSLFGSAKQFCYYFSLSICNELMWDGIRIMVACPGHMDDMKLRNKERRSQHMNPLPVTDNQLLAANILKHAEKGEASYTPGLFYKIYRFIARFRSHEKLMENAYRFY